MAVKYFIRSLLFTAWGGAGGWSENFGCLTGFCSILMIPSHLKSIF